MSEVHRYNVVTMFSESGNRIGYDPHGPTVVMASEFDRVTAERDGLQLALNTADQTVDDLQGAVVRRNNRVMELELALREIAHNYNHGHLQHTHKAIVAAEDLIAPVEAERDQGIPGTSFQRLNMLANQGE